MMKEVIAKEKERTSRRLEEKGEQVCGDKARRKRMLRKEPKKRCKTIMSCSW